MTCSADEKIKNIFSAEHQNLVFEIYSENGQINEHTRIFSVFVDSPDGTMGTQRNSVIDSAKTIFDEVFLQSHQDGSYEMFFYGLITHSYSE